MPRFFVESLEEDTLVLSGEDGRHIAKSLRQQPGEELELCDGRGTDALAVIRGISGEQVTAEIRERRPSRGELPCRVTLYQALPKGDKLVFIVQKAVELGAAAIVPVLTSRCISRPDRQGMEKKRERLGGRRAVRPGPSAGGAAPSLLPGGGGGDGKKPLPHPLL